MTRVEVWPEWFARGLRAAIANGNQLAIFDTEYECSVMRLKFYKYLAALREEFDPELSEPATRCTVQWLRAPNSNSKRLLRIVVAARATVDPLKTDESIEEELEKERLLAEMRAQFRTKK